MKKNESLSFAIYLKRDFLKWAHSHRFVDNIDPKSDLFNSMMGNLPEINQFFYSGIHEEQFKNTDDITSFIEAINELFEKSGIDKIHRHPLLYLSLLLFNQFDNQRILNSRHNVLNTYARFIIDLAINCVEYFNAIEGNNEYEKVIDPLTREIFFVKKTLITEFSKKGAMEEIYDFMPIDPLRKKDVIRFLNIKIFDYQLSVPDELWITISKDDLTDLKTIEKGITKKNLEVPKQLRREMFSLMINALLSEHERSNTDFYNAMKNGETPIESFNQIYLARGKYKISKNLALTKLAILINDYFRSQGILLNDTHLASFLFKYYSFLRLFNVDEKETPLNYKELPMFYIKNGFDAEYLRRTFKDTKIHWGIN